EPAPTDTPLLEALGGDTAPAPAPARTPEQTEDEPADTAAASPDTVWVETDIARYG
ncbi:MAG: hypothetical protein GWN02_34990, partial [Gemmatimonadetes bacterium]|nr:hypothetical protein [Gemmatimonadota bacterium]